jgi:hypothetical protein
LDENHFYHVSPAYAKRFQKHDETEEQYVERLRKELEDKFLELGPETVIGCTKLSIRCFQSLTLNEYFFYNQSSRKQWLGLPLVSLLHQRVISKVAMLSDFLINKSNVYIYLAMKTVCDKFGALFILDEVRGLSISFFFPRTSC